MGGYNTELPIMEDCDLCIRLHVAGPASFRSKVPVGAQLSSGAKLPAATSASAAGGLCWVQSDAAQAFLDQRGVSYSQDCVSDVPCSSTEPPPLRQRHRLTSSAAVADCSQGLAGSVTPARQPGARSSTVQPPTNGYSRWLISVKDWAVSHCRRRGRIAVVWFPVAHTSGRRLEALGNVKVS